MPSSDSSMKAWLQLVRVPNLFTAAADVLAGFFFASGGIAADSRLGFAVAASVLIYAAGVVLNDVFDVQHDLRERPHRPIASGSVSWMHAAAVGATLLVVGWLLAYGAGRIAGVMATGLVASVMLYDGLLKQTVVGPPLMGLCRAFNLWLGLAAAGWSWENGQQLPVAVYVGCIWLIYVASVTFFARREAGETRRSHLQTSLAGMFVGLVMLALLGVSVENLHRTYLIGLIFAGVWIGPAAQRAIRTLAPADVQAAVRAGIYCLVILGACLAWGSAGIGAGLLVAAFLVPAVLLGRWFETT